MIDPRGSKPGGHATRNRRPAPVFALFAILAAAAIPVSASHHLPDESDPAPAETIFEVHTHSRLFASVGELSIMGEYAGRFEGENRDLEYQSFTLGGYYRILRNLKAGLFYRLQINARHDDDWIEVGPAWLWADTTGRAEHVAIVDITPRVLLRFLPGGNWVASVKNRYEYNFSNSQQSLLVRPGLTWFLIRDREPVLNVSAQYAGYLSLNFGDVPWYRHGPYLNFLYQVAPGLQVDLGLSRQWIYWSESEQYLADFPTSVYEQNIFGSWLADIGVIFRLQ